MPFFTHTNPGEISIQDIGPVTGTVHELPEDFRCFIFAVAAILSTMS
jgi:hypothetical protein